MAVTAVRSRTEQNNEPAKKRIPEGKETLGRRTCRCDVDFFNISYVRETSYDDVA
jgi:hypothetical protein